MRTQLFRLTFFLLICVSIPLTTTAQTVDIPDPNLRAVIEVALSKTSGATITVAEMETLTYLEGDEASISDLTGLEFAINLTWLHLGDNSIPDVSAVAGLTNLSVLYLWDNSISDISPLTGLINLIELGLANNSISDISPLAGLINLEGLYLGNNPISDISPLTELTNLTGLNLDDNSISDIPPLTGLTNLIYLDLGGNSLSDISVLAGLTNLTELDLVHNSISDISPLAGLTNLKWLWLYDNAISDISALVANTGLGAKDIVGLRENSLNYPSIHTHIPVLRARDVRIRFRHRTPMTILNISGYQRGSPSVTLNPFVVEVQDKYGSAFEGVPVTFAVTTGDGTLSVTHTTTDENGRAQSTLTVGQNLGVHTVSANAAGWVIDDPVIFNVISGTEPPPTATDVNDDGVVNILDLVLVASAYGNKGPDLPTDINGDGVVNMLDLVWVADALGAVGAAPSQHPHALEILTAVDVKLWLSQAQQFDLRACLKSL